MKYILWAVVMSISLPTSSVICDVIPRQKLFTKPNCLAAKISPDEKRMAYVGADAHGAMNIFVSDDLTFTFFDKFANSMVYLAYSEWLLSHLYQPLVDSSQ